MSVVAPEGLHRSADGNGVLGLAAAPHHCLSVAFALILVLTVFGWTNGRAMVRTAYSQAKDRATERRKGSEEEPGPAAPSVEG
jgi:hypothetical protein